MISCLKTDMGFCPKILLIIFIIGTFYLISFHCNHIFIANNTFNAPESYNVNALNEAENNVLVLEKLRSLLGVDNFLARISSAIGDDDDAFLSPSPSPSPGPSLSPSLSPVPSPSPSPVPLMPSHRKHSHLPLPLNNHHHLFPPTQRIKKQERSNATKIIITSIIVSAGITSLLCAFGLFWGCKKQRNKATTTLPIYTTETRIVGSIQHGVASECAMKKVSSDPEPDLFYLDSLSPALDTPPLCLKQNPTLLNTKCKDNTSSNVKEESDNLGSHQDDDDECFEAGEIISAHEARESNQMGANVCNALSHNDVVMISEESHSSEDESFHSVSNSQHSPAVRLSIASVTSSSLSEYSEAISSKGSLISSPTHLTAETLPLEPLNTNHVSNLEATFLPTRLSHPPPPPPPPPPIFLQGRQSPLYESLFHQSKSIRVGSSSSNQTPQIGGATPKLLRPSQGIPPPPFPPPFPKGNPYPPSQILQYTPLGKAGSKLPKLKPLHWDKVRAAPNRSTVWDKLRSSSFEFDEEMIESLFGYNLQNSTKNEEVKTKTPSPTKHVLEPKRLHNITILSKALNVTTEQVCDALMKGKGLSLQELEALSKMVPTKEEEAKLANYKGNIHELGSAEKLVMAMLDIPFAFSRVEGMLYKETFEDELIHLRKSFYILEEACKELRSSRLFLKLLEAVLKTGNRMNVGTIRGGAKAFKLDALLKLADVKGTDGKTNLLHFVVQEITKSEGFRASESIMGKINQRSKGSNTNTEEDYTRLGLDLVSGLSTELCNVKKTAALDLELLANSVSNLSQGMLKVKHLVYQNLSSEEQDGNFISAMKTFLKYSEKCVEDLQEDENRVLIQVREITEYFHGDVGKDDTNPLRIFVIVRDFLGLLDHVCKELRSSKTPYPSPNPLAPFR